RKTEDPTDGGGSAFIGGIPVRDGGGRVQRRQFTGQHGIGIMNRSQPYGASGQQRLPTPDPERRIGSTCAALPSPRPSPDGSPLPSDGRGVRGEGNGRAGRGRNVRRAAKNQPPLMVRNGFDGCSLSHRAHR